MFIHNVKCLVFSSFQQIVRIAPLRSQARRVIGDIVAKSEDSKISAFDRTNVFHTEHRFDRIPSLKSVPPSGALILAEGIKKTGGSLRAWNATHSGSKNMEEARFERANYIEI